MLLDPNRYRLITGDQTTSTSEITAAAETAQDWLEADLGRELEYGVRVDVLEIMPDGTVYPPVLPLHAVDDYEWFAGTVYGVGQALDFTSSQLGPYRATISYTGGYAASAVPADIEADLAWATYQILRPADVTAIPAGATSVRLGDAAVTFAGPIGRTRGSSTVQWSPGVWRYRRRRM
jgi:hypothetical protein